MLTAIDWTIMIVLSRLCAGYGLALKRYMRTSTDFFLAGRSIPAWVCVWLLFLPIWARRKYRNGCVSAKYGISTSHFYWIGAIPAMVFIGVFMMPFLLRLPRAFGTGIPASAFR